MSQQITLNISDEMYLALQKKASTVGLSVSDWLITILHQDQLLVTDLDKKTQGNDIQPQEAHRRLLNYAGKISLGYATGVNNEEIEADLAKAYTQD